MAGEKAEVGKVSRWWEGKERVGVEGVKIEVGV